jgi:hypothetical protein
MADNDRKHSTRIIADSIVAPAVRTVMLIGFADEFSDEEARVEILPVLAIRSTVTRSYKSRAFNSTELTSDDKLNDENGWHPDWSNETHQLRPVVAYWYSSEQLGWSLYDTDHICDGRDTDDPGCPFVTHIVACPWDAEHDDERLKPHIKRVQELCHDRAIFRRSHATT